MPVLDVVATSSTPGLPRRSDRGVALLVALVAGANVLFVLGLVASNGTTSPAVNVGISLATQWLPVAVFVLIGVRTRARNLPALLVGAAVLSTALGDTIYTFAMDADGYLPFPSAADPAYLLFYPLMIAALLVLARRRLHGLGVLVVLEAAVAAAGASTVLALVLDPVIVAASSGDGLLPGLVAIAYPACDILLLAVLAGLATVPTSTPTPRRWALVSGLVIFAVADVGYALLENQGTYLAGSPLDATWAIGLALVTWWGAGVASRTETRPAVSVRTLDVPLPALAVAAGLVVLVVATQLPVSLAAVALAALTVGIGVLPLVFRQAGLRRTLAAQEETVRRITRLDQDKRDLMVTLNHEFRTPLTSVTGHVELLLDGGAGQLPPAADRMLQTIARSSERLEALLDATLTVSELEHDPDPTARVEVALDDVLDDALAAIEDRARARAVRLTRPTRAEVRVVADATRLADAFVRLLDNAVKFSEPGAEVSISLRRSPDDRRADVLIHDTGKGIPADELTRVFERFTRASNVQNAAIPGVGLGLTIARSIVEAHGGSITLDSAPESGTVATVTLPVRR